MSVTYRVRHKTSYEYGIPVTLSHHLAHLKPRETPYQHVVSSTLTINPQASFQNDQTDAFGNTGTFFIVETPYREMTIISEFNAELTPPVYPDPSKTLEWEKTAQMLSKPDTSELLQASAMVAPSSFIPPNPEIREYALISFSKGKPILEVAEEIMHRIHSDFIYDPNATDITTPLEETLRMKRGVCQDFAHIGIACLRQFGLAARYVSGYIRTYKDQGKSADALIETVGGDASHAWFSVYVPEFGWVDLDPTNNMYLGTEHLTTGWGRDFNDMSPIKGIITGGGAHTVNVDVSVLALEK